MLVAGISNSVEDDIIRDITTNHVNKALRHGENELEIILKQVKRQDVMKTSSTGRFLDSISALLGINYQRTYEGEPAMKLEALATNGNPNAINFTPDISQNNGKYVLNTSNIMYNLLNNREKHKTKDIAAFAQKYIAEGFSLIAIIASEDTGIKKVGLSGGVMVNGYINKTITNNLEKEGMTVLHQEKVPPGDGGTALGQSIKALDFVI
jgi:hydrogenase maturation protein HypF